MTRVGGMGMVLEQRPAKNDNCVEVCHRDGGWGDVWAESGMVVEQQSDHSESCVEVCHGGVE